MAGSSDRINRLIATPKKKADYPGAQEAAKEKALNRRTWVLNFPCGTQWRGVRAHYWHELLGLWCPEHGEHCTIRSTKEMERTE